MTKPSFYLFSRAPAVSAAFASFLLCAICTHDKNQRSKTVLSEAKLQSITLTSDIDRAETFYRDTLELRLRTKSDGALVFDVGGGELRVSPVPATQPSEHTVLGFSVPNVETIVLSLSRRGVGFERFDGFPHDELGILTTPDGSRVAWFRDPDGNLLSVVQYRTTA